MQERATALRRGRDEYGAGLYRGPDDRAVAASRFRLPTPKHGRPKPSPRLDTQRPKDRTEFAW